MSSPDGRSRKWRVLIVTHPEPEAIHGYFSLSYANYLVLHRTLMQSMPDEWQNRMVQCLNELEEAFDHIEQPETFFVKAAVEREICNLTEQERDQCLEGKVEEIDTDDEGEDLEEAIFLLDGQEVEGWQRVLLPAEDSIPHYNRGRTHIEPLTKEKNEAAD